MEEPEGDKEDLRAKLEEQADTIAPREEDLTEIEALRLDIRELHQRWEAEFVERSQSRVQILKRGRSGKR